MIKVSLNVRAGNQGAIALYLSEGFEVEGRERLQIRREWDEPRPDGQGGGSTADGAPSDSPYEDNLIMGKLLERRE